MGSREIITSRIAREFADGYYVNLGIGMPTLCANYIPEGADVVLQSENGLLGIGPFPFEGHADADLINAGKETVTELDGSAYFSSAESFAMIRGGHIDVSVLGALQVSEKGDLANWMLPQRGIGNVGGAMDLAAGAKRTIVAMEHVDKKGTPKIVRECDFPLTGTGCVSLIVTDIAVLEITPEGLVLKETAPGWTPEEIQAETEPTLVMSPDLQEIVL